MKIEEMTVEQKATLMTKLIDGGTFEYMDYCKKRKDDKGYDLRAVDFCGGDFVTVSADYLAEEFEKLVFNIKEYDLYKSFLVDMGVEF